MLVQLPFFAVLYQLFTRSTIGAVPNELLTHTLFGVRLDQTFLAAGLAWPAAIVFVGLLAALAVVATWSSIRVAQLQTADQRPPGEWLIRVLPYLTMVIAAFVPLAAGLYLLTTTTWASAEPVLLHRVHDGRPRKAGHE